jgi:hypothetical protein
MEQELADDRVTVLDPAQLAKDYEQLRKAAHLAELACEALSSVSGQVELWERLRELVFALKDERDGLADMVR